MTKRLLSLVLLLVTTAVVSGDEEPPLDMRKAIIEAPTKALITDITDSALLGTAKTSTKVAPGRVRWHADFEAACAAAKKSGKPVLLFQLLGQLDERFT